MARFESWRVQVNTVRGWLTTLQTAEVGAARAEETRLMKRGIHPSAIQILHVEWADAEARQREMTPTSYSATLDRKVTIPSD